MSGYLSHLAESASAVVPTIQPRLRGIFEPTLRTNTLGDEPSTLDADASTLQAGEQEVEQNLKSRRKKPRSQEQLQWSELEVSSEEDSPPRIEREFRDSKESRRYQDIVEVAADDGHEGSLVRKDIERSPKLGKGSETEASKEVSKSGILVPPLLPPLLPRMPLQAVAREMATDSEVRPASITPAPRMIQASLEPGQNPVRRPHRSQEELHPSRQNARDIEPVIKVTIGRVEVRATTGRVESRRNESQSSPVLSLDDYLRQCAKRGRE